MDSVLSKMSPMSKMSNWKIGIDIQSTLGPTTGLGVYTNLLVQGLKTVSPHHSFELISYQHKDLNTLERLRWENFGRHSFIQGDDLDLLHVPAFAPGFRKAKRQVVTVHDLIAKIYPENLSPVSRLYWSTWLPKQAIKSDHIIVISENTKRDLVRFYQVPETKISVISLCVSGRYTSPITENDRKRVRERYGLKGPYFLSVGTLEPRKNLPRLISAYGTFRKKGKGEVPSLVLTGLLAWGSSEVKSRIEQEGLSLGNDVVLTGYVPVEDLPPLYGEAEAFIFPSLYEGFGLPVLEAMTVGTPVIASNASSIPEVVGKGGLLVDPLSEGEMVEAMGIFLHDRGQRETLRKEASLQARKFTQEKMARETLAVYEKVLGDI